MTEPKTNYEYIGFNTYVCRTQAVFNRAENFLNRLKNHKKDRT